MSCINRETPRGAGRNRNQGDGRNQRRRYEFWSSSTASQAQSAYEQAEEWKSRGLRQAGWAATNLPETARAQTDCEAREIEQRLNEQLIAA